MVDVQVGDFGSASDGWRPQGQKEDPPPPLADIVKGEEGVIDSMAALFALSANGDS